MSFDEQPDGDIHGECAAEIHSLQAKLAQAESERAAADAQKELLNGANNSQAATIRVLNKENADMTHDIARLYDSLTQGANARLAAEQRAERCERNDQRYQFLKSRLEVPGAIQQFLSLNNWHPDTDMRDIDAAIDLASSRQRDMTAAPHAKEK